MAITQEHIDTAVKLAKEYGATRLLLFGSALDDPENANDLDLGVDGIPGMKFFEYGGKVEYLINKQVDIVDLSMVGGFVQHILKYGKFLYDNTKSSN